MAANNPVEATDRFFRVVLVTVLYKGCSDFLSVSEILKCDSHSTQESYSAVICFLCRVYHAGLIILIQVCG